MKTYLPPSFVSFFTNQWVRTECGTVLLPYYGLPDSDFFEWELGPRITKVRRREWRRHLFVKWLQDYKKIRRSESCRMYPIRTRNWLGQMSRLQAAAWGNNAFWGVGSGSGSCGYDLDQLQPPQHLRHYTGDCQDMGTTPTQPPPHSLLSVSSIVSRCCTSHHSMLAHKMSARWAQYSWVDLLTRMWTSNNNLFKILMF